MSDTRVDEVLARLRSEYPTPVYALAFDNPLQLLVGAILAAQCTDARVNTVTPKLAEKYPDAQAFADADLAELEEDLSSISFYRQKAKSIQEGCKTIVQKHGGVVPTDMESLLELPRVARKTANLVLTLAHGIPSGIVVDTHVARLSQRLGLSGSPKPEKIEEDLLDKIPSEEWVAFGPRLTLLGREVCDAKEPNCGGCVMNDICPKVGV